MLVSTQPFDRLYNCLVSAGCEVVKAENGESAIAQAQHGTFQMAILVSTGTTMDIAETALNLRDVNASMQIVVVADEQLPEAELIACACPNTVALAADRLAAYLEKALAPSAPRITYGQRKKKKTMRGGSSDG